eukprot:TRINITY_DN10268_c0_g1_i1.p1 TRINITY_DN10268_c0_g1~~TRINITY_DN10268_c0_g1_i1.p1  ORF type:complete len:174 (-),score=43.94 TRINITY_DN10268_c0_g1_i1:155-676(-)
MIGGEYNIIEGKIKDKKGVISRISGKWDSTIFLKHLEGNHLKLQPTSKMVFWEPKEAPPQVPKIVDPIEEQNEFESRRLWSRVSNAIRANNQNEATEAKFLLEEGQRERQKNRGGEWVSTFFRKKEPDELSKAPVGDPTWVYTFANQQVWDPETEVEEMEIQPGIIMAEKKSK